MRKIFLVVAVVMATMLAFNVAGSGAVAVSSGMEAVQAGDDDSNDGKEKKKKEKKKKNKKEKTPKTAEEIIALLQGLEWKKPAKSGLEVDKYYDEADEFFKMLKTVADSVTIYKPMKVVTPGACRADRSGCHSAVGQLGAQGRECADSKGHQGFPSSEAADGFPEQHGQALFPSRQCGGE